MDEDLTRNQGLFSDHYLRTRLPEQPEWQADYGTQHAELDALLDNAVAALPTLSEAQTEQQFIRPVLDALGWSYETQITFRALGRDYRPDYALFASEQQRSDARSTVPSRRDVCEGGYLEKTAALAEAKYWERPLEVRTADDTRDRRPDRGRSPHFQMLDYLRDSGVEWGILTNGRTWRLYLSDTSEILYYEADLAAILERGSAEDFKRFYLFFGRDAFVPDQDGVCFLDRLREESQQYARQVEDSLKERVFDLVVPALAEGFLHHLRDEENVEVGPVDRETLHRMYGGTLLLLYRLFFLLFAEARDLIAVGDDSGYEPRSLQHLKQEIFDAMQNGVALGTTSTDWWDDLRNLFRVINRGDSGLNVPRYNGGLFAPDGLGDPDIQPAAEFLEENAIADRHLAHALILLTGHVETEDDYASPEFIDFRDLGVRHLGSVYEGLLEFKLNIAEEPLVKATERGKPVWKPTDHAKQADKQPGQLYLTNDKSERKATGSYYTPDYIVGYIVENTIGPQIDRFQREHELVEEINAMAGRGGDAAPTYTGSSGVTSPMGSSGVSPERAWDDILDDVLEGKPEDEMRAARELWDGIASDAERRTFLLNQLDGVQPEHGYDPPSRVLGLKVLDPAMGSGHFLVGALDYITTRLAAMLNEYADSPVFERIRQDRAKIVESLGKQGIQADPGKLTDENLLRRLVMKKCLYGVDLNPLAVELSKLSLWLHAFTAGAPLSFLDHHVKCGNSLIGIEVEEVERELTGPLWGRGLRGLGEATAFMHTIAELTDASFEEADESRRLFHRATRLLEPDKWIMDCWVSEHFGNEGARAVLKSEPREARRAAREKAGAPAVTEGGRRFESARKEKAVTARVEQAIEQAGNCLAGIRTFHWELEFPEVFFHGDGQGVQRKPRAGFDAVIGNPPYRADLTDRDKRYFRAAYATQRGDYDTYVFFMEGAARLAKPNGLWSLIVPDTFTDMDKYVPLRQLLFHRHHFLRLAEAKDVFPDAIVENVVPVLVRSRASGSRPVRIDILGAEGAIEVSYESSEQAWRDSQGQRIEYFVSDGIRELLNSIRRPALPLSAWCTVRQGLTAYDRYAGQDEQIIESRAFHSRDAEDETYKPWLQGDDVGRYTITWSGEFISYGPWLAAPRAPDIFAGPRLLVREVAQADNLFVAYTGKEFYYGHSVIPVLSDRGPSLLFLAAACASKLLAFWTRYKAPNVIKGAFPKVNPEDIRRLPIRRVFFNTPVGGKQQDLRTLEVLYEDTSASCNS